MRADEAAESVSCPPFAILLTLTVSVFPLSPPRLPASFTRSTRHYRTGCCTLPFTAAATSCRGRLSHARPRRVSHSGAPTLEGSIDLRDSIAETCSPESRSDRSDYLEAGGRFFWLSPVAAKPAERAQQGH